MKLVNKCILSRFIAPGFRLAVRADSHEKLVMFCPFVTLCWFISEIEIYNLYLGISAKHEEVCWNGIRLRDLLLELLCFER